MGDVPVNYVPRLANQVAHRLAKNSLTCFLDRSWERTKEDIINGLEKAEVSKIVLVGGAGMGKTWMAREIIDHEELWYETLWVYVTEKYDINLFYKDIARQLSLSSIAEEWEHEGENSDRGTRTSKNVS
ncbi:hypothetical protein Dsin_022554 [Dipteronia sinensis]|uniref:NB-ARC domain-containing protein n=1 Tax=Dipteronia sinensis TaxID=43782 RepID=A0AAE0A2Q2_9ROSI|nr:hypothetical protein Dsin_022554 [Dipteronia sinensis]